MPRRSSTANHVFWSNNMHSFGHEWMHCMYSFRKMTSFDRRYRYGGRLLIISSLSIRCTHVMFMFMLSTSPPLPLMCCVGCMRPIRNNIVAIANRRLHRWVLREKSDLGTTLLVWDTVIQPTIVWCWLFGGRSDGCVGHREAESWVFVATRKASKIFPRDKLGRMTSYERQEKRLTSFWLVCSLQPV